MPPPYETGPIRDPAAARICSLAGLNRAYRGLVTLRELDRGTELALQEIEAAKTRAELVDKALVVARFTKATCDAFIGLAAELSSNKAAKGVANAYGVSDVAAGAVGDLTAGARIDVISLKTDALKAAAPYAGTNAAYGMKSIAVKTELIRAAMNANQEEVLKRAAEYNFDLATYTLDHLAAIEKDTKTGAFPGAVSKFIDIGKEIFQYNEKVGTAFDAYLKDAEETGSSFRSQKQSIKASAENIRRRVRELEKFIESCEASLNRQAPHKG